MIRSLFIGLTAFVIISCGPVLTENQTIVSDYVTATNDKDFATIERLMHRDIEWIQINGAEQQVMSGGRDALITEIRSMAESGFETRSELRDLTENGQFVTAIETAYYTRKNGEAASQSANSIYEIEKGVIRRVWYFPVAENTQ